MAVSVFVVKSRGVLATAKEMAQKYGQKIGGDLTSPGVGGCSRRNLIPLRLHVVDIHPVARGYVHWLIADIQSAQLAPGGQPARAIRASPRARPYAGPFPPSGTHDYEFTLYALRTDTLRVRRGATLRESRQAAWSKSLWLRGDADRKVHQDQVTVRGAAKDPAKDRELHVSAVSWVKISTCAASPRLGHHIRGTGGPG